MNTLNIILICAIAATFLLAFTLKIGKDKDERLNQEHFETTPDKPTQTRGAGATLIASASSITAAANQAATLISFVPDVGSTYNADKSVAIFPSPSQTWLLDYQTQLRNVLSSTLDNVLSPPNTLLVFTEPNFLGRAVFLPFSYLPNIGSSATFINTNAGHAILFSEILQLPKPVGGNTFSCVVPSKHKAIIGFANEAPSLEIPEGAHAALVAPTQIASVQIVRTASP